MITKPKGTSDIFGKKAKKWKYIEEIVDGVMQKYNYTYIRTPLFESTDLYPLLLYISYTYFFLTSLQKN